MSFAEYKAQMRRAVHSAFSLSAEHNDGTTVTPIRVRWHSRLTLTGQLGNDGYSEILDNITRLIFNAEELNSLGLTLSRDDTIKITENGYNSPTFVLENLEPSDGPIEIVWKVARYGPDQR